jgi:predicted membrane chloride channel (bestrophin family)
MDLFFLCLLLAGLGVWAILLHPRLPSVLRLVTMSIIGITLLVVLQAGNNSAFDRVFRVAKVVDIPPGLDAR